MIMNHSNFIAIIKLPPNKQLNPSASFLVGFCAVIKLVVIQKFVVQVYYTMKINFKSLALQFLISRQANIIGNEKKINNIIINIYYRMLF
jgi:hypothetical protein